MMKITNNNNNITTKLFRTTRVQCKYVGCKIMVGWKRSEYCYEHYMQHGCEICKDLNRRA